MPQNIGFDMRLANDQNARSWTETFYCIWPTDAGPDKIQDDLRQLAAIRAGALVVRNQVVDITYFQMENPSVRTLFAVGIEGTNGVDLVDKNAQDVAPVSVLIQLSSAARRRQYLQRGVVDLDIRNGTFQPAAGRAMNYKRWTDTILGRTPGFSVLYIRRSLFDPALNIVSISPEAIFFEVGMAPDVAVGTQLAIKTRIAGMGPKINTRIRTTGVRTGNSLPVIWTNGNCTGGTARRFTFGLEPIVGLAYREEARTRRTGGPFTKFRGSR